MSEIEEQDEMAPEAVEAALEESDDTPDVEGHGLIRTDAVELAFKPLIT
jgi:hypothetical protein